MNRIAAAFLLAWVCMARPAAGADKPLVVDLWPGKPPDETGTIGPEKVHLSPRLDRKQVEVTEPTRLVTNVTRPTLTGRPSRSTGRPGTGTPGRPSSSARGAATGTCTGSWRARRSPPG
jgi:hypothetical protein